MRRYDYSKATCSRLHRVRALLKISENIDPLFSRRRRHGFVRKSPAIQYEGTIRSCGAGSQIGVLE